jgi:hypothetical protein
MLKRDELANPNSCINKAAEDEPVFVLRAQDAFASDLVRLWASRAALNNAPPEKVAEAVKLAEAMEAWPGRKYPD